MPDHFVERKPESSILAFADYDAEHTSNSRQKNSAKKEKVIAPKIENVKSYFLENNFPEIEANKFFNYFSSNGWLVGGKTPMIDWQAAAQNWILNAPNFKYNTEIAPANRSRQLNTGTDKDYSEPL